MTTPDPESQMRTQVGFTGGGTPVLLCLPTHELHWLAEDGSASTDVWAAGLPMMRLRRIADMTTLDEIPVDTQWTVQLGPAKRRLTTAPQFITTTGVVRGPAPQATGQQHEFYRGTINAPPEWLTAAHDGGKIVVVTTARDGGEHWATTARTGG